LCITAEMCLSVLAQSVPSLVNYQGRLTDQTGSALAPAAYGIQFRLWDSPTGTNGAGLVWAQQQIVTVQSNGVFNVILGSVGGSTIVGVTSQVNDLSLAFGLSNRFIAVTVVSSNGAAISSLGEILPRQQLLTTPYSFTSGQAASAVVATHALDGIPVGTILPFGGTAAPPGFLLCDGSAYSSVNYSNLFSAIGTIWGSGSGGGNNFNVPDFRGRTLIGSGVGGVDINGVPLTARAVNQKGGEEMHKLTILEMPSHAHNYSGAYGTGTTGRGPDGASSSTATSSTGGDQPHNTMPPFAVVSYIIKY